VHHLENQKIAATDGATGRGGNINPRWNNGTSNYEIVHSVQTEVSFKAHPSPAQKPCGPLRWRRTGSGPSRDVSPEMGIWDKDRTQSAFDEDLVRASLKKEGVSAIFLVLLSWFGKLCFDLVTFSVFSLHLILSGWSRASLFLG